MTSILSLQYQNAQGLPTHDIPFLLYVSLAYTRDIFTLTTSLGFHRVLISALPLYLHALH